MLYFRTRILRRVSLRIWSGRSLDEELDAKSGVPRPWSCALGFSGLPKPKMFTMDFCCGKRKSRKEYVMSMYPISITILPFEPENEPHKFSQPISSHHCLPIKATVTLVLNVALPANCNRWSQNLIHRSIRFSTPRKSCNFEDRCIISRSKQTYKDKLANKDHRRQESP